MVGALNLAFDISAVAVSTAVPGIAWALLFALAWRRPELAESLGLGRRTFWLLLPGALLASFAFLPVAPVSSDILAVSFAGAGFPLAVGILALNRIAPPMRRSGVRLFVPLIVETVLLLAVVLLADGGRLAGLASGLGLTPWETELSLVVLLAAAFTVAVVLSARRSTDPNALPVAGIFALTSGVLVLTFAGAQAIPGVGIAESFPYFLVPPIFGGIAATLVAPRLFRGREAFALPVAFLAASWGVVLGADILWQPPLYAPGSSGLYAIGGAGVLDLVYLSGFLGLFGAWVSHRLLGRSLTAVGAPVAPIPLSPAAQLREAYVRGMEGSFRTSVTASAAAARAAGLQTQRLMDRAPTSPSRPWEGLPVPGWVVADQANLDSVARSGTSDPREALRSYVTARSLVVLGMAIGRSRFASVTQRLAAFAIDSAFLGAAGSAVFVGIVLATPGNLDAVLASVPFNAAIYGLVAVALVYFSLTELWFGATLGMRLLEIEVRDRSLGTIGGVAAFVRNAPLLPVVTLYSIGLSLAIAIGLRGISSSTSFADLGISTGLLAMVSLGLVVFCGIALAGGIGIATMAITAERQRVGDLWADTWVVRRSSAKAAPLPAPVEAARSG